MPLDMSGRKGMCEGIARWPLHGRHTFHLSLQDCSTIHFPFCHWPEIEEVTWKPQSWEWFPQGWMERHKYQTGEKLEASPGRLGRGLYITGQAASTPYPQESLLSRQTAGSLRGLNAAPGKNVFMWHLNRNNLDLWKKFRTFCTN